jgi:hypothetical protein
MPLGCFPEDHKEKHKHRRDVRHLLPLFDSPVIVHHREENGNRASQWIPKRIYLDEL